MTGNINTSRNPDENGEPLREISRNSNPVTQEEMVDNPDYSSTDRLIQVILNKF